MSSLLQDIPFWHLLLKLDEVDVNKISSWHFKLGCFSVVASLNIIDC